ncbi:MAG: hypothetical protein KDA88_08640 [Planctomycetaceae bacterium]|nr:hypothetical protein [Planctomycetaceae bacterium]MCB9952983.1 hypothetical protein [Planctomycetaceae bacterium]
MHRTAKGVAYLALLASLIGHACLGEVPQSIPLPGKAIGQGRQDNELRLNSPPDAAMKVAVTQSAQPMGKPAKGARHILNINFGKAPEDSAPNGVIGGPHDVWTQVDVHETSKLGLPMADGTPTDITLELSENDGVWGIPGSFDVYHAYLYHNCRCVDLTVTLRDLPAGMYEAYVFAHGDAPDQNAAIEIQSGGTLYSGRKTLNDGTYDYRSRGHKEGNQFVKYTIEVTTGEPVVITSKRDGSSLSMLNAIQMKKLKVQRRKTAE